MGEIFLPYRPSESQAVEFVTSQLERQLRSGQQIVNQGNVRVTHVYAHANAQIVFVVYTQWYEAQTGITETYVVERYQIMVITHRWLSGLFNLATSGGMIMEQQNARPNAIVALNYRGVYAAGSMINVSEIQTVQATWADGALSVSPITNGAYFFVRQEPAELAWTVGLDARGLAVPSTMTFPDESFSPLDYQNTQLIQVEGGMVIVGAYSEQELQQQICIDMIFVTRENVRRFFQEPGAFTKQRTCADASTDSVFGPSVYSTVEGNQIVGGRVLSSLAVQVHLIWSDRFQQTVSVDSGLFIAQRLGSTVSIVDMIALDSDGKELSPN
ncbi:MAG: hypothetical protein IT317_03305 [Anaerolineales bacterium]|nr:hypothetical protein [Anaerolineales bacterium]